MSSTFVPDFLAYHRAVQDRWQPEDWRLELAVFLAERRRNRPALSLPACGPGSQRAVVGWTHAIRRIPTVSMSAAVVQCTP